MHFWAVARHTFQPAFTTLAKKIEELKILDVENFTRQEIDFDVLVEVELNGEVDLYMLLHCGGGSEVSV